MNFRVQKALTALLVISFLLTFGSCMPIARQETDLEYVPSLGSSDVVTSEKEWNSSEYGSDKTSSSVHADTDTESIPGKGNQVIVDTDEDVGAMDDPEDPMKPNHNPEEEEPEAPQDTIVIPLPGGNSSSVSSGAISSTIGPQPIPSTPSSSVSSGGNSSAGSSDVSSSNTSGTTTSIPSSSSSVSSATSSMISSILSSSPSSAVSSMISSMLSSVISSAPSVSSKPPFAPPATGWYDYDGDRYLYQNGNPVSGYQSVNGFGYYFEPNGKLASKFGIDVSKYQTGGTVNGVAQPVDWAKVKAAGVDYAIIRVGYRGYGSTGNMAKDPKFLENITNATSVGMDCGLYFFTQAKTEEEAREEARTAVKWLEESGKKITYPIYFDTEISSQGSGNGRADKLTVAERTATAKAFCEEIKRLGYYPGIYASTDWLNNYLDMSRLAEYDVWVAHYRTNITLGPGYTKNMTMWQYTSKGSVPGIAGNVDCNIGLRDYASYIRQNGYNKLTESGISTSSTTAESAVSETSSAE